MTSRYVHSIPRTRWSSGIWNDIFLIQIDDDGMLDHLMVLNSILPPWWLVLVIPMTILESISSIIDSHSGIGGIQEMLRCIRCGAWISITIPSSLVHDCELRISDQWMTPLFKIRQQIFHTLPLCACENCQWLFIAWIIDGTQSYWLTSEKTRPKAKKQSSLRPSGII